MILATMRKPTYWLPIVPALPASLVLLRAARTLPLRRMAAQRSLFSAARWRVSAQLVEDFARLKKVLNLLGAGHQPRAFWFFWLGSAGPTYARWRTAAVRDSPHAPYRFQ